MSCPRTPGRTLALLALAVALGGCALVRSSPASSRAAPRAPAQLEPELLTASVASLTADQIRGRNAESVAELFELLAGVSVVRAQGRSSLRVRTAGSLASAEPLVIIDGIPVSRYGRTDPLLGLVPSDIERIDVIKDGATAMYGVRGGRGVVLIRTRLSR